MKTEHNNGKPQETELPRFIEEKPIVYDEEHLEEVRETAALPPIHLSPDEIEFAISLFVRGFARGDVVLILIETFPELQEQGRADDTFRKRLSDRLRTCDPTSAVFAQSRYKTLYNLHQEHVRGTLGNTYDRIDSKLKDTLLERVEAQTERLQKIDTRIDHLHQLYSRYQMEYTDARMIEVRDDAFRRLQATDQSLLKWYNVRMKEEQQLMKLFISLKTSVGTFESKSMRNYPPAIPGMCSDGRNAGGNSHHGLRAFTVSAGVLQGISVLCAVWVSTDARGRVPKKQCQP